MELKDIKPYLDVVIHDPFNRDIIEITTSSNEKYGIFFYHAFEFVEPCLFACIITHDNLGNATIVYGIISDDSIIYEKNSHLPLEVKNFISRLVKMFPFI